MIVFRHTLLFLTAICMGSGATARTAPMPGAEHGPEPDTGVPMDVGIAVLGSPARWRGAPLRAIPRGKPRSDARLGRRR
jgi:hypothetical protein